MYVVERYRVALNFEGAITNHIGYATPQGYYETLEEANIRLMELINRNRCTSTIYRVRKERYDDNKRSV